MRLSTAEKITTTATTRLKELEDKLAELREERRKITDGMTEAEQRDKVEAILRGEDLDQAIGTHAEALDAVDRKIALLMGAIRGQAEVRDQERTIEGREAREKLRPEWERHLKTYYQGIARSVGALKEIAKLNGGLHGQGFAPFPHVYFPGWRIAQENFARQDQLFTDICRLHGINIK